jgi:hypothetical protein
MFIFALNYINKMENTKGLNQEKQCVIHVVVLSFFYIIGIACGLVIYFENNKTYGLALALIIMTSLIINYIKIIKHLINMLKKY